MVSVRFKRFLILDTAVVCTYFSSYEHYMASCQWLRLTTKVSESLNKVMPNPPTRVIEFDKVEPGRAENNDVLAARDGPISQQYSFMSIGQFIREGYVSVPGQTILLVRKQYIDQYWFCNIRQNPCCFFRFEAEPKWWTDKRYLPLAIFCCINNFVKRLTPIYVLTVMGSQFI